MVRDRDRSGNSEHDSYRHFFRHMMRKEAVDRVDAAVMQRLAIVAGIDEGQNIEEEKNAGGFGERLLYVLLKFLQVFNVL